MKRKAGLPRLLFVDRDPDSGSSGTIIKALSADFDVVPHAWLTEKAIELIKEASPDPRLAFSAVVSHLPPASVEYPKGPLADIALKYDLYGPAFMLLGKIKDICDIPVIIYTGASINDLPGFSWGAAETDSIIFKGRDPAQDGKKIKEALDKRFLLYARLPPAQPEPEICRGPSSIWTETAVRLNSGFGVCGSSDFIRLSGKEQRWKCYISRIQKDALRDGAPPKPIPVDDILELMLAAIECGERIRIEIEGTDAGAEELLRKMHRLCQYRYLRPARRDDLLKTGVNRPL